MYLEVAFLIDDNLFTFFCDIRYNADVTNDFVLSN